MELAVAQDSAVLCGPEVSPPAGPPRQSPSRTELSEWPQKFLWCWSVRNANACDAAQRGIVGNCHPIGKRCRFVMSVGNAKLGSCQFLTLRCASAAISEWLRAQNPAISPTAYDVTWAQVILQAPPSNCYSKTLGKTLPTGLVVLVGR